MRRMFLVAMSTTVGLLATAATGRGQGVEAADGPPIYDAPGYYGTIWGAPTYGSIRTHSAFASPFGGPGYGLGYGPSGFVSGPFGAGLWRPGSVAPGYAYAPGAYRTFPAIAVPAYPTYSPPFGYYAPGFGPPLVP